MSTEDYRRHLAEECNGLESQIRNSRLILKSLEEDISRGNRKIKGLSTMIENLTKEKESLSLQVSDLRQQVLTGEIDADDAELQIYELEKQIAETDEKLRDKESKLEKAEHELSDLKEQLREGNEKQQELLEIRREATSDLQEQAEMRMSHALLPQVLEEFKAMLPSLNYTARQAVSDSLLNDMCSQGNALFAKAVRLFIGYADEATMVADGGGGGTSSDLPWGRQEDEDERDWARRCMKQARMISRKASSGRRR